MRPLGSQLLCCLLRTSSAIDSNVTVALLLLQELVETDQNLASQSDVEQSYDIFTM